MKKMVLIAVAFIGFALYSEQSTAQRIVVNIRPSAPAVVRMAAPSPQHVWIGDEWIIRNGIYVHQPGYWSAPKRGRVWVSGHWQNSRGGFYWVPGHWARNRGRRF